MDSEEHITKILYLKSYVPNGRTCMQFYTRLGNRLARFFKVFSPFLFHVLIYRSTLLYKHNRTVVWICIETWTLYTSLNPMRNYGLTLRLNIFVSDERHTATTANFGTELLLVVKSSVCHKPEIGTTAPENKPRPKVQPDIHTKKNILCVWWNWGNRIHWESISINQ